MSSSTTWVGDGPSPSTGAAGGILAIWGIRCGMCQRAAMEVLLSAVWSQQWIRPPQSLPPTMCQEIKNCPSQGRSLGWRGCGSRMMILRCRRGRVMLQRFRLRQADRLSVRSRIIRVFIKIWFTFQRVLHKCKIVQIIFVTLWTLGSDFLM